jgi:hypothetical protein
MRRGGWAALVAVLGLVACGEGGSLPGKQTQGPPATTNPDGTVPLPDIPETPDAGTPPEDGGTTEPPPDAGTPPPPPSLWPLTQGSSWTYRITDPVRGTFEKRVEVLGEQTVPETNMTATAVLSTQPHLRELSWQLDVNGVVVRLREEDRKGDLLARVMTWSPATVKALAREQPVEWRFESTVRELTRYGDGSTEEKEKVYVWRVAAVNETVTTPAGTFTNAIRLERERGDKENRERTYWLVPGIGKVKEDGERLEELISYDVKKP